MLLTSVIIVLREILEAALLISTLLAATRFICISHNWLRISISSGIAGALLLAWQLRWISNLYGGPLTSLHLCGDFSANSHAD